MINDFISRWHKFNRKCRYFLVWKSTYLVPTYNISIILIHSPQFAQYQIQHEVRLLFRGLKMSCSNLLYYYSKKHFRFMPFSQDEKLPCAKIKMATMLYFVLKFVHSHSFALANSAHIFFTENIRTRTHECGRLRTHLKTIFVFPAPRLLINHGF